VDGRQGLVEEPCHRIGVARGDRPAHAIEALRGDVRAHAAGHRRGCHCASERLEARDRVLFAIDVEVLDARHETIAVEEPERERHALEITTTDADAGLRPAREKSMGLEGEHVVDAAREALGRREQGFQQGKYRLASAERAETENPVVVELDAGCDTRVPRVEVGRSEQRRDRARRRRRLLARRALGRQLGVALVEPRECLGQAIGGECLLAVDGSVRAGLRELKRHVLVRTDVVAAARIPARARTASIQRQTLADGRERLELVLGAARPEQALE